MVSVDQIALATAFNRSGYADRAAQAATEAIDKGELSGEPVNVC